MVEGRHRFEGILRGNASDLCDQPLIDLPEWVVAPTVGSIVPGWLLIIPRLQVLNFRDGGVAGGPSSQEVIGHLLKHIGLRCDEVIWFEHGPSALGTIVGCGLDHAHVHVLIRPSFSFDAFEAAVKQGAPLHWRSSEVEVDYSLLSRQGSYLIAGSGSRSIAAEGVEAAGSQFFRRAVASLVGASDQWNYKRDQHLHNVAATVEAFRALEVAAANV